MTAGPRGRLIALEGIDGCGKSTQAALLAGRLGAVLTFEPGATALGGALRGLLLGTGHGSVSERAEALLMVADRAQHVAEVVAPALDAGRWVVTDRFSGSTYAYQGYGRGLDQAELETLVSWAAAGVGPDLNVLIEVPVGVAAGRRAGGGDDRLEGLGTDFQRRVAEGFRRLADDHPDSWLVVDGNAEVPDVAARVWSGVRDRFGDGPGRG